MEKSWGEEMEELLQVVYNAIEDAIYYEDGLDGLEGQGILKEIKKFHPKVKDKYGDGKVECETR